MQLDNNWLRKYIDSIPKKDKETFKFGNKILMAITHVTVSKIKNNPLNNNAGVTKEEVIDTLNMFTIEDKFYNTKKHKYCLNDAMDISYQVFQLTLAGYLSINPEDYTHIKMTPLGLTMGLQSFNIIKPMKVTAVYEMYNDISNQVDNEINIRNN